MPRIKREEPPEPEGFIMTPMIDVTFQLIVFFMLVNDMTRINIEALVLPPSQAVYKENVFAEDIWVCNIAHDGTVKIKGETLWTPAHGDRYEELARYFQKIYMNYPQYREQGSPPRMSVVLIIRADAGTEFANIQRVLIAAAFAGRIYKVKFTAKREEKEEIK